VYNGSITSRWRVCSTENSCDTVTGLADDGEAEDHVFASLPVELVTFSAE
jgi:hypothetical protein